MPWPDPSAPFAPGISLLPHVRHYAWGGKGKNSYLRNFLKSKDLRVPFAEAWYGAHPLGPSRLKAGEGSLNQFLNQFSGGGKRDKVGETRGLPFLIKLIEARSPLSLQVHPNERQARVGFRREESAQVPRDSPQRSFRDQQAKPELLIAVRPFALFAGFRSVEDCRRDPLCRSVGGSFFEFGEDLKKWPSREFLRRMETLSSVDGGRLEKRLPELLRKAGRSDKDRVSWMRRLLAARANRTDPALALLPFLAFHRLRPGEGMFLPAGVPHLYLKGVGVEVTGCSDNVIRLGLTPKPCRWTDGLRMIDSASPIFYSFRKQDSCRLRIQGEPVRVTGQFQPARFVRVSGRFFELTLPLAEGTGGEARLCPLRSAAGKS